MSDVMDDATAELMQMMRASAMMARLIADRRRESLWRAEAKAREQAHAMRQAIARELDLARPVIQRAHDPQFWATADRAEVARLYGTAARYGTVDHGAAVVARICESEALRRWGISLHGADMQASGPAARDVVASQVAPALAGVDDSRDWDEVMREAADLHDGEVAARQGGDVTSEVVRETELVHTEVSAVLDDHPQVTAVEVSSAQALDEADNLIDVPDFHAFDEAGAEVVSASEALNEASDLLSDPSVVLGAVSGQQWDRDGLLGALGQPLSDQAVTSADPAPVSTHQEEVIDFPALPAPPPVVPDTSVVEVTQERTRKRVRPSEGARRRWDSQEARARWAQARRSEGHDPRSVRAALAGDRALSRPAVEATSKQIARKRLRPTRRSQPTSRTMTNTL